MFTGLVENIATITKRSIHGESGKLELRTKKEFKNLLFGESIAVNGVCLTLEKFSDNGSLSFHVLAETFKRTNLGALSIGSSVNLERSLAIGDRLGGHFVTGHVDANALVREIHIEGGDRKLTVCLPDQLKPYLVEKGSVSIDGVSLTLVEVNSDSFTVHLIPVTWNETALNRLSPGDNVNLEGDLIGKYVHRQVSLANIGSDKITMKNLSDAGW